MFRHARSSTLTTLRRTLSSSTFRASHPLDTLTVNFDPNSGAADADPTCVGTLEAPTAPPGQVCIYLSASGGFDVTSLSGDIASPTTRAFFVGWAPSGPAAPHPEYDEFLFATWAYTAP